MSTRSTIGYETQDGGYVGGYCHFDGYPKNIGPSLHEMLHADVVIMVEEALRNGGMRCLNGPGDFEDYNERSERERWLTDTWPELSEDYAYRKRLEGQVEVLDSSGIVWEWKPKG